MLYLLLIIKHVFRFCELTQTAARQIKDSLDKKYGASWHVCIGEGYGFDVTYHARSMMYLYYGEKLGILVFKA